MATPRCALPRLRRSLAVLALAAGGCEEHRHLTWDDGRDASAPEVAAAPVDDSVRVSVAREEPVSVLVLLDPARVPAGLSLDGGLGSSADNVLVEADTGASATATDIARAQASLRADVPEVAELHAYAHFPMSYVRIASAAGLEALIRHPAVQHVYANRVLFSTLNQSLPLIRQPAAAQAGALGAGVSVAVLDTGTDYTRATFGSCTAPGSPGCKVAVARDFAADDGSLDENGHGTNVAGIVLGVAPAAKVLALDVFAGPSAYSNVILEAVDWVIANRALYGVAAINLSLGSGLYAATCPNDVFAAGLGAARAAGILPVVASGNNAQSAAISSPACVPAALSVGAVYDGYVGVPSFPSAGCTETATQADQITCFSNSAPPLSMLAPGSSITAAGFAMSGTSQAAPHVAGAAAVLAAAYPQAGVEGVAARLTTTGPLITDPRNGLARHRLDLSAALDLSAPTDTAGPAGSVVIAGGAAQTRNPSVSLALTASDPAGVVAMCIANDAPCSAWLPFATQRVWSLPAGDGAKSVYAQFKDSFGNVSAPVAASILLDTTRPKDGSATLTQRDGQLGIAVAGASDAQGGPLSYLIAYARGGVAPSSCDGGTPGYLGGEPSATITGLDNGVLYAFRVCVRDAAGNTSSGVTLSGRPAPELQPPSGSLSIASGAAYTASTDVRLTIRATDASGIAQMCISSSPTACSAWTSFANTAPFRLDRTSGVATVYVQLRDPWQNQSREPLTDTILVDTSAPTVSSLRGAQSGAGRIALDWAASDAGSGVASYQLQYARGAVPPANCNGGQRLYAGELTSFAHAALPVGKHAYRLCATDRAGHTTLGKTLVFSVR